jgi:hypothetical protein
MRLRNQRGCLRCTRRKTGPSCWEFLWRENDAGGNSHATNSGDWGSVRVSD